MEYLRKKYVCKNQIKKGVTGVREAIEFIKKNHSIALMIDQRVSEGEKINFFNKPALTTTLPAQLSIKYNLGIIPVFIERDKNIFMYEDNHFIQTLIDQNKLLTPLDYSISIYKENIIIPLNRCIHNYNIIGMIDGKTTIYLFNPKHKDEILNKTNNEIKKWGHKLTLQKDDTILIPTNWYYIQETKDKCIQYHIEIDDIFTYLPTLIKSKISYK